MKPIHIALLFCLMAISCKSPVSIPDDYEAREMAWRDTRMAELLAPNGWMSLVGLYWLKEGVNNCGSATDAEVALPAEAPTLAARYMLANGQVLCEPAAGSGVVSLSDNNCTMGHGSLVWTLIERGGRYGIRVRDTLLPTRIRVRAIEHYPLNTQYRVAAKWTPAAERDSVAMRNVWDMTYKVPVAGQLHFQLNGQQHTLTALDGGPDELFLIFADATTGDTTHGGGRHLYCPKPDAKGQTILDFNRAHSPPCAFTSYATCLLPRAEDHLSIAILAGELAY